MIAARSASFFLLILLCRKSQNSGETMSLSRLSVFRTWIVLFNSIFIIYYSANWSKNGENTLLVDSVFKSANTLMHDTPHFRDDLISCCYVLREMTDLCLPWNKPEMRVSESDMIALKVDINGSSLFGQGGLWVSHRETEESPNCLSLVTIFDNIRRLEWGEEPNYKLWATQ